MNLETQKNDLAFGIAKKKGKELWESFLDVWFEKPVEKKGVYFVNEVIEPLKMKSKINICYK